MYFFDWLDHIDKIAFTFIHREMSARWLDYIMGQHFLADVTAGALIGTFSGLLVYWYLRQVKIEWVSVRKEPSLI